jgi:type II secretory pathway pseudopilin PulG
MNHSAATTHPDVKRLRHTRRAAATGFTLIETALATVIVGVGVLALVSAQQAFHAQNRWSTHASIAVRLGNEIREMTLNLPRHDPVTGLDVWGPDPGETSFDDFDDLDDFDTAVFSEAFDNGPINAARQIIPNMPGWAQSIEVVNVDSQDITDDSVGDGATDMVMVRVTVTYQGPMDSLPEPVTVVSWLAPK